MSKLRYLPCLVTWMIAQPIMQAQIPVPNFDFKFRGGATAGSLRDDLRNDMMIGLAVGAAFPVKSTGGSLTLDFGYDYFPGRGKDCLPGADRTIYYNYNGSLITNYNGSPLYVVPSQSYGSQDTRNIGFDGLGIRVGYRNRFAFLGDGWSWQAGLSLDHTKSKNQFTGYLYPHYKKDGKDTVLGPNEYEGWAYNRERSKNNLNAFIGLVKEIDEAYRWEVNLRSVGYGIKTYTPTAYTGRAAELANKDSRGLVAEFSFVVKL